MLSNIGIPGLMLILFILALIVGGILYSFIYYLKLPRNNSAIR